MKSLLLKDLNPKIFKRRPEWALGMLDAANLINDMYSSCILNEYLIGDCILAKMGVLKPGKKIRRNPILVSVVYNHKVKAQ